MPSLLERAPACVLQPFSPDWSACCRSRCWPRGTWCRHCLRRCSQRSSSPRARCRQTGGGMTATVMSRMLRRQLRRQLRRPDGRVTRRRGATVATTTIATCRIGATTAATTMSATIAMPAATAVGTAVEMVAAATESAAALHSGFGCFHSSRPIVEAMQRRGPTRCPAGVVCCEDGRMVAVLDWRRASSAETLERRR